MERLLLIVDEAAEALALSRSTIYRLLESGDLIATRIGTATRIPKASLRQ
jgi:excisionase family DNA binding protein